MEIDFSVCARLNLLRRSRGEYIFDTVKVVFRDPFCFFFLIYLGYRWPGGSDRRGGIRDQLTAPHSTAR